jgi:hypothetical protein
VEAVSTDILLNLANDSRVFAVDVGRLDEWMTAVDEKRCTKFSPPDPLWYQRQALHAE